MAVNPVLPFLASNTYRFGVAGSYTGDGWNATANLTYNFYDSPATFSGNNTFGTRGPFNISDALNLDLTATKKFGKFEIGAIGYGTVNLDPNLLNRVGDLGSGRIGRGGRFLLGGLIGYDFGAFTTQFYVARTVARTADSFDSTEGWFRIVAPLYTPPPPWPSPRPRWCASTDPNRGRRKRRPHTHTGGTVRPQGRAFSVFGGRPIDPGLAGAQGTVRRSHPNGALARGAHRPSSERRFPPFGPLLRPHGNRPPCTLPQIRWQVSEIERRLAGAFASLRISLPV